MTPLQLDAVVTTVKDRLIAAGLCGGSVTAFRETPTQDDDLPTADVFIGEDSGTPDGDPRTGHVMLIHETKLGIDIRAAAPDGVALRTLLSTEAMKVYAAILPEFYALMPYAEGLAAARIAYVIPPESGAVIGRAMVQFEILHRQSWEPTTTDAFNAMTITTPGGLSGGAAPQP
jgi:hypothetical protein